MVVFYAVGAIVLLAVVAAVVLFRRQDRELATGSLTGVEADRKRIIRDKGDLEGKDFETQALEKRSQELAPAEPDGPVIIPPMDPDQLGEARRAFLNRSIIGAASLGLAMLGGAILKTLWPSASGGFGDKIVVGNVDSIKESIRDSGGFFYFPLGRMWITEYPTSAVVKAETSYGFYPQVEQGLKAGVVALFQTCPHLGCRVPECETSQWFECPCHGSQYNRVGEKKGGPAPRGMDRFPMEVSSDGVLTVDTGTIIQGPPIGVNTTGQEAEGPNCLSDGGGEH